MIDTFDGALNVARAMGLSTLQAELLSEQGRPKACASTASDYLLAATRNDLYNSLICSKLAPVLGRGKVFQLAEAAGRATTMASSWTGNGADSSSASRP